VGLAYRPVRNDRLNALFRYTQLDDLRPEILGAFEIRETKMGVLAAESAYRLHRRLEWWAKLALREEKERIEGLPWVESDLRLAITRFNVMLLKRLDIGIEYRVLDDREADDQKSGWLGELTFEVLENFRVGAGYNFTDFSDDEFTTNDYSVDGWFLRVQGRY
jgi:hypothetical protein